MGRRILVNSGAGSLVRHCHAVQFTGLLIGSPIFRLLYWAGIAVVVFLAHYLRFPAYGLYEDDYWGVASALGRPVGDYFEQINYCFATWPQGRPLNHIFPYLLGAAGSALGGLKGVYALSYVWLTLNCILVFEIALEVLASHRAGVVAALIYILFPADTTRILLVHAAHLQGAMTFLLLGIWLLLRGGWARALSYPVAGLCLLSYESTFLPFLTAPFLTVPHRKKLLRNVIAHLSICAAIVGVVGLVRVRLGESRALSTIESLRDSVYQSLTSLWLGPKTSGALLFEAPALGLGQLDFASAGVVLVVLALLIVSWRTSSLQGHFHEGPDAKAFPRPLGAELTPWWWILMVALVTWCGTYSLTLINYPPTQTLGRMTSTHLPAAWPVSLGLAALAEGIAQKRRWTSRLVVGALAIWTVGAIGYQQYIQRGYVRAFQIQQDFWQQVLDLAPEAETGWTVIVEGDLAPQSPVIQSNSWTDFHVFRLLLGGDTETSPESAFGHLTRLRHVIHFSRDENSIYWTPKAWNPDPIRIDPARLILLHSENGRLSRVDEIETSVGKLAGVKASPSTRRNHWPDTPLARALFPDKY